MQAVVEGQFEVVVEEQVLRVGRADQQQKALSELLVILLLKRRVKTELCDRTLCFGAFE